MALADELKTPQELHANGKLTDQEYADAKAATLNREATETVKRDKSSFLSALVRVLILIFLIFLGVAWYSAGTRNTTRVIQTVVQKTKTYIRTGQLGQGSYYLVTRDTSLRLLSARARDISVTVKLNP